MPTDSLKVNDFVTIIETSECHNNGERKLATKRWYLDNKGNPATGKIMMGEDFWHDRKSVSNIYELAELLEDLTYEPYRCVIRGKLGEDIDTSKVVKRRKLPRDKDGGIIWFKEVPHHWVVLDIDHLPLPDIDLEGDPEGAIERMIDTLPEYFHDVTCFWRLSSSAGMGDEDEISAHLTFWLSRSTGFLEMREWMKGINDQWKAGRGNGKRLLDPATVRTVQPIYCAAPEFDEGIDDPISQRCGLLEKDSNTVTFPAVEIPVKPEKRKKQQYGTAEPASVEPLIAAPPSELLDVTSAIDGIAPETIRQHDPWLECVQALHSLGWREGLDLAHGLSRRSGEMYDPDELDFRWETFGQERGITIATLYYHARRDGWLPPDEKALRGVERVDLGNDSRGKSVERLHAAEGEQAKELALAIVRKFGRMVPLHLTETAFIDEVGHGLDDTFVNALRGRLRWILSVRTERAVQPITLSDKVTDRHRYEEIDGNDWRAVQESAKMDGVTILKAGHGSGKTQRVGQPAIDTARNEGLATTAVVHRVSLTYELAERLGMAHYQAKRGAFDPNKRGLAVCANSIIRDSSVKTGRYVGDYCERTDVLFLDEITQTLRHIVNGSFTDTERLPVMDRLESMIRNAKRVILADADLNDSAVGFIEAIRPNEEFRIFEQVPNNRSLSVTWEYGQEAFKHATGSILVRAASGQKLMIATDSREKVDQLVELLRSELPDLKVIGIHSGTTNLKEQTAFLRDADACSKLYDVVVHSPSVSSGVSIQNDHFDFGFGCFFGTVTPADGIQMLRRVRRLTEWHISLDQNNISGQDDPEAAAIGLNEVLAARGGGSVSFFDKVKMWVDAEENQGRNNFAFNLIKVLEHLGFQVSEEVQANPDQDVVEEALEAAKQAIGDRFKEAVLNAPDISWQWSQWLEQQEDLTPEHQAMIARCRIMGVLNPLDQESWGKPPQDGTMGDFEEYLTSKPPRRLHHYDSPPYEVYRGFSEEDIDTYDKGRIRAQLARYEIARGLFIPEDKNPRRGRSLEDLPVTLHKFPDLTHKLYRQLLEVLGIDLETGEGWYGDAEANRAIDLVMRSPYIWSYLGIAPHTIIKARPEKPVYFINQRILSRLGLKTKFRQRRLPSESGGEGVRIREYRIKQSTWDDLGRYADRRKGGRYVKATKDFSKCQNTA